MEKDLLGHLPKSSPLTLKQEIEDVVGSNDHAKGGGVDEGHNFAEEMRRSGLQLSFSNNDAASSRLLSFNSAQDQGGCHSRYPPGFSQRNLSSDNHYPFTGRRWQPNASLTNPTIPAVSVSPVLSKHLTPNGSNLVGTASVMTSASNNIPPPNGPLVGSTDLRGSSTISTGPCQLTIFYNGSVCVYDNVSPEKAQAIMLLAGNGDSTNSNAIKSACPSHPSTPKLQPAVLKPSSDDTSIPNHSLGFLSLISLPQPITSLSNVTPSRVTEVTPVKAVPPPPLIKSSEPPKSTPPSGVPQARKASLARFLEKRKERC